MGHYASEMGAVSRAPEPEDLANKRAARQQHNEHVWKLHAQYQRQGDHVDPRDLLGCPACGAAVMEADRDAHDRWHATGSAR